MRAFVALLVGLAVSGAGLWIVVASSYDLPGAILIVAGAALAAAGARTTGVTVSGGGG